MSITAIANAATLRDKLLEAIDGFDRATTKQEQDRFKALIAHFQKALSATGPIRVTVGASGFAV